MVEAKEVKVEMLVNPVFSLETREAMVKVDRMVDKVEAKVWAKEDFVKVVEEEDKEDLVKEEAKVEAKVWAKEDLVKVVKEEDKEDLVKEEAKVEAKVWAKETMVKVVEEEDKEDLVKSLEDKLVAHSVLVLALLVVEVRVKVEMLVHQVLKWETNGDKSKGF
jgi:poly-D-alanine transfer protein DltD